MVHMGSFWFHLYIFLSDCIEGSQKAANSVCLQNLLPVVCLQFGNVKKMLPNALPFFFLAFSSFEPFVLSHY